MIKGDAAQQNSQLNVFRLLRIARNLKVKQVAESLDVSTAYIIAIEKGDKFPSVRLLREYAKVLNVSADILLTFQPADDSGSMVFERTLLKLLRMICPKEVE